MSFIQAVWADRILGMGDVVSLVERAQEQFDEKEARKLQKKNRQGSIQLQRFLESNSTDQEDG